MCQTIEKPTLLIRNLSFAYHNKIVLQNVNLDLYPQNNYLVVGQNGSGKSTLLQLICGLLKPQQGTIEFGKRKINIAYLPQNANAAPDFPITCKEYIESGYYYNLPFWRSLSPGEQKQCSDWLDKANLSRYSNCLLSDLSSGQRQKLQLARCLLRRPEILLLDESTVNLDKLGQNDFFRFLRAAQKEAKFIGIFVTHAWENWAKQAPTVLKIEQTACVRYTFSEFSEQQMQEGEF